MFKRLRWLTIGAGFGFGMSFWITRTLRHMVARYAPHRVTNDLASTARAIGRDLREAIAEGHEAMRQTEAELRAQLAAIPASRAREGRPMAAEVGPPPSPRIALSR